MTAADLIAPGGVACAHCGLDVAAGDMQPDAERQFCCAGCGTAWAILHEHGLDQYYRFSKKRLAPVGASIRTYEEFDHEAFRALHVRAAGTGALAVDLLVEGIHCASCVWLVERVPLVLPGVIRAELDTGRSRAMIVWDPSVTTLSAIARLLASLGYPPHPVVGGGREALRRKEDRAALIRIGVAGAIAVNVMLAALAMYAGWFQGGLDATYERYFRWLSLVLVIPAIVGPGRIFFTGAWAALRTRALHLDLPIAIALGTGAVRGAINTVTDRGPVYLDGIAILIFLLLVGRYLQQRWQRAATDASELLYALTPNGARIVHEGGAVLEVPVTALVPGMTLDVRAGDTFPADGVVAQGVSAVNAAWLTGESRPVPVTVGAEVLAGTINLTAALRVTVTGAGEETRVARVLRQVEESARRRAPVVLLANRLAGWFVAVVLLLAVITWLVWLPRDASAAADYAIALLIVTCPCALAMATPLSVTVALGRAARRGIFVKGGDALQVLAGAGRMLLDKTGTITEGRSTLMRWDGPDHVRPLVLALESGSVHPLAEGFRAAWPGVSPAPGAEAVHTLGGGIEGRVREHHVVVGSPRFVSSALGGVDLRATDAGHEALTPVYVGVDGALVGRAWFGDAVRTGAASSIAALTARGWRPQMLSGDARPVCEHVAREVGLQDAVTAESTPEGKRDRVAQERAGGHSVIMVGDGVNDAAAMASASVGVAVHGGAEAALASADVYLTTPGLEPVVELVDGARRTMRVVRRNIVFSLAYNVVGVMLAITGHLNPVVAAIMMPLSSLTVVAGAWYGHTFGDPT